MKYALAAVVSVGIFCSAMFTMDASKEKKNKMDKDGHVLTGLWNAYSVAKAADLPKQMSSALEKIKEEARRKHLVWDFYDAAVKKVETEVSLNWKLRDSLNAAAEKEISEYGEPVAVYSWMNRSRYNSDAIEYVLENKDRLQAGRNTGFYQSLKFSFSEFSNACPIEFKDDYEFALWSEYLRSGSPEAAYESLEACLEDSYPNAAVLEIKEILRPAGRYWYSYATQTDTAQTDALKKKCEDFIGKYSGKAVALYAEGALLRLESIRLEREMTGQDAYKALYAECRRFEKERKAFCTKEGVEKRLVENYSVFTDLSDELTAKSIRLVLTEEKKLKVILRNLDKVDLEFVSSEKGAEPMLKRTLENPEKSFCVPDTLEVQLPGCDDGEYLLKATNGKVSAVRNCSFNRLSMAVRQDSGDVRFYVADHRSGEPVDVVDLEVYKSGKLAGKSTVKMYGFTPVPEGLEGLLKGRNCYLAVSRKGEDGLLQKSPRIRFNEYPYEADNNVVETMCRIFTDKAAFNPGETVKFKALLFSGDAARKFRVVGEGRTVKAELVGVNGKTVETKKLTTNEYGSVAGNFLLPEGERNGTFRLMISMDGKTLGSRTLVVDEFILPTYDVEFDEFDRICLAGDTLTVTGKVKSYSGHPLSSAKAEYSVTAWSRVNASNGGVEVAADGSFSVSFPTFEDSNGYTFTLRVTDGTGETQEFNKNIILNQLRLDVKVENAVSDCDVNSSGREYAVCDVVSDRNVRLSFEASYGSEDFTKVPVAVEYSVKDASGNMVAVGAADSKETEEIRLDESGEYFLTAQAALKDSEGKVVKTAKSERRILILEDSDTVLSSKVESVFKPMGPCVDGYLSDGEMIALQFGAGDGPLWAVVELFGDNRQLLDSRMVYLAGEAGKEGSLTTIGYSYTSSMPDAVLFQVFYFRRGRHCTYSKELRRERPSLDLPLVSSSFQDKALPGTSYSFVFKSLPAVEAVASVFDLSSEAFASNVWSMVSLEDCAIDRVWISAVDGSVGDDGLQPRLYADGAPLLAPTRAAVPLGAEENSSLQDAVVVGYGTAAKRAGKAGAVEEEKIEALDNVVPRSDFSNSLAFEPFLRTGEDGDVVLEFKTTDKLSTFAVQLFAHDKEMRNAALRKEMMVTLPVKVSVVEPEYLYLGDRYVLRATVSNSSAVDVSGIVGLQVYPTADHRNAKACSVQAKAVDVPAGGSVDVEFEVPVREVGEVGLKLVFSDAAETFSDGVFVSVPVLEAAQTLTESHSAVLLAGTDKAELVRKLEKEFTGTTHSGAEVGEVDIRRMLLDAVPSKLEPQGKDVLSLSEAFYVRKVASSLGDPSETETSDEEIYSKILSCRNADGGFGWFEGMNSSPVVTAVVLERFAKLKVSGLFSDFDAVASVKYLDDRQFLSFSDVPYWSGRLSDEQYVHLRSIYSSVPFEVLPSSSVAKSEFDKRFKEFKKDLSGYLLPKSKDGRGLNGQILYKARRIKTLANLVNNEGGMALASVWGIKLSAASKMNKSIAADVASLLEYSVAHPNGGCYYPNAVMPWRGLLESELYAHSLLCDLFSDERVPGSVSGSKSPWPGQSPSEVADGIRIWLILQKETQKWGDDPAFVDAIASVMSASEDVLSTSVVTLTKTYRKPFGEIAAAGNGFTVVRKFYREAVDLAGDGDGRVEIHPGDSLHVGDKLIAEYRIWNEENRSFVKLTAPREAGFRPVDQLSGHYGWRIRPLSVAGFPAITPQGYRNVKSDCTEYCFDVYPEENSVVSEALFVTQEGVFSAPVVTIESLYAPHYRANSAFSGQIEVNE